MAYPNYPTLAGSSTTDVPLVPQLFAGSAEITTNRAQGGANVNLAQYTVIAILADKIVAWNPAASDDSKIAAGILSVPLNTDPGAGGVVDSWAPYYTGGDFNHETLVWPVSVTTLAQRRAAFSQTGTIKISATV